jgi:hypothetical protein
VTGWRLDCLIAVVTLDGVDGVDGVERWGVLTGKSETSGLKFTAADTDVDHLGEGRGSDM